MHAAGGAISWETWSVPVSGGEPTLLLPNASGLTWLGDRTVLFSELKTGLHMGIVTATEDRASRREIYFPAHERAMAHFSYASPDRRHILLVEMVGAVDLAVVCRWTLLLHLSQQIGLARPRTHPCDPAGHQRCDRRGHG